MFKCKCLFKYSYQLCLILENYAKTLDLMKMLQNGLKIPLDRMKPVATKLIHFSEYLSSFMHLSTAIVIHASKRLC